MEAERKNLMKRDLSLIRELLLYFEAQPDDRQSLPDVQGYPEIEVEYHLILMFEAGLIRAEPEVTKTGRTIRVHAHSLTWQGHEFLDMARDKSTWKRVSESIASKVGSVSFDVLKEMLVDALKDSLK